MHYQDLLNSISSVNNSTQTLAARSVNQIMTLRNWLIGAYIIEFEQGGSDRAAYGTQLIRTLSEDLSRRRIKGLSVRNLSYFRQFAIAYPAIGNGDVLAELLAMMRHGRAGANNLPNNGWPILQTLSAESELESQTQSGSLFPALEVRAKELVALPWQDGKHYQKLISTLSWSHLLELSRIEDLVKRALAAVQQALG